MGECTDGCSSHRQAVCSQLAPGSVMKICKCYKVCYSFYPYATGGKPLRWLHQPVFLYTQFCSPVTSDTFIVLVIFPSRQKKTNKLIYEPSYCNFPESRKKNKFYFSPLTLNNILAKRSNRPPAFYLFSSKRKMT